MIKAPFRYVAGLLAGTLLLSASPYTQAQLAPRTHIHIVGSSTAYPIIASAAERFGRNSGFTTPVVESTGTGGGIKLFCNGLGLNTPDIAMASRSMKSSERASCEKNHVTDIREIKIGYDGIVLASSKAGPRFALSSDDLYRALARQVPAADDSGKLVTNPYSNWRQISPDLPDLPIRVYGPPPTSGTRDILAERLLHQACLQQPTLRRLHAEDPEEFAHKCYSLREDGAFINAGENDARLVRKLIADPDAIGIFGYNFLDRNRDRLQAAAIDGELPDFESIESRIYPLSRPLYLYVKPSHHRVVSGLQQFVERLVSEDMIGAEGLLIDQGLIPLPGK